MAVHISTASLVTLLTIGFARRSRSTPGGQWMPAHGTLSGTPEIEAVPAMSHMQAPPTASSAISHSNLPIARMLSGTGWERFRGGDTQGLQNGEEDHGSSSSTEKKLKPFVRGSTTIVLNDAIYRKLENGEVWQSAHVAGNVCSGRAVMDVEASTQVVWGQLNDFASYPNKVPKLSQAKVYKREVLTGRLPGGGSAERSFVKFVSPLVPGVKLIYHVNHTYEPTKNSVTWQLDGTQKNDFQDIQGHWHVTPHPESTSKARVFYEIGTVVPTWFPKWLKQKLVKKVVLDATSWVKHYSELAGARESKRVHQPMLQVLPSDSFYAFP